MSGDGAHLMLEWCDIILLAPSCAVVYTNFKELYGVREVFVFYRCKIRWYLVPRLRFKFLLAPQTLNMEESDQHQEEK